MGLKIKFEIALFQPAEFNKIYDYYYDIVSGKIEKIISQSCIISAMGLFSFFTLTSHKIYYVSRKNIIFIPFLHEMNPSSHRTATYSEEMRLLRCTVT